MISCDRSKVACDFCMGSQIDESQRAEDVEIYYDPAELFGGLLKGPLISPSQSESEDNTATVAAATHGCPFSK